MTDTSGHHDLRLRLVRPAHQQGHALRHPKLHLRCGGQCGLAHFVERQRRVDFLHLRQSQPVQHGGGQSPAGWTHHHHVYLYNLASNVATVTYPNGLASTFTYDPANRLTDLSTSTSGSSQVASYDYVPLSATGMKTVASESTSSRNLSWSYDGI